MLRQVHIISQNSTHWFIVAFIKICSVLLHFVIPYDRLTHQSPHQKNKIICFNVVHIPIMLIG